MMVWAVPFWGTVMGMALVVPLPQLKPVNEFSSPVGFSTEVPEQSDELTQKLLKVVPFVMVPKIFELTS